MAIVNDLIKLFYEPTVSKAINLQSNDSGLIGGFADGSINFNSQNDQKLINNGYGSNVTVYSIINKITTTASTIPLIIWDKNTDEIVEQGKMFELIKQPAIYRGELLSTSEWIETCLVYLLTTGNLYQKKINLVDFRTFDSLEIIPSGIIEPIAPNSYLRPNSGFSINDKESTFNLSSDEISHLKYINPTMNGLNTLKGLAPLQAGLYALTGSTDIQKAISVLVKNQGVRGILSNESNRGGGSVNLGEAEAKQVKQQTNDMLRGVDKINQVAVTSASLKYQAMGMNASDLKLIESGILTDRQLCNIWGVDSKLFNDPNASTFNNLTEATKGMYINAIIPALNKIVSKLNQDITKGVNLTENTNHEVRIDTSKIDALQSDQKLEAEKNKLNAEGVAVVLSMPISNDAKIEALIYTHGITEELANNIVGDEQIRED